MREIRTTQQRLLVLGRPYLRGPNGEMLADRNWEAHNLVRVALPGPLPLAWDKSVEVTTVRFHRLLAKQLGGVFEDLDTKGLWKFFQTFGGTYIVRKVRARNAISPHTFAAAIDFDPEKMPLGSGVKWPANVLSIWHAHGFICGQEFSGRKDPMHFEAVKCFGGDD
jgi:hypothetical protein